MSEARKGKFRVKAVNRRHSKTVKISVFANRIRRGVGPFEVFGALVLFFVPMQSVQMSLQFHLRKLMLSEGLIQHNGH